MVLKSKKKSYLSVYKSISIVAFPTEVLLVTFSHLDFPALLCLSNVCKRFQFIGEKCIAEKFKESNVALSLSFEQERKWNYGVHFSFDHFDLNNGRFVFKPKISERMKFIHSSMIKKPTIYKIQIIRTDEDDGNNVDSSIAVEATTNNSTRTRNNVLSTTQKNRKLPENFVQNSCTFSIKQTNGTVKKIAKAYRIGHGTTHLKTSFRFIYSITDTPPPSENVNRGGERWITPKAFECYPCFFYPHEPIAHKIMMNLIELKKRSGGGNKKNKTPTDKIPIKQNSKGKNVVRSGDPHNKGKNVVRSGDPHNKGKNVVRSGDLHNKGKNVVRSGDPHNKGKNVVRSGDLRNKGKNVACYDDLIMQREIELDLDGQEISHREGSINSDNLSYLQEIQERENMIRKLMGPIKSSTRWVRGARR